jgi:hypothetical protein
MNMMVREILSLIVVMGVAWNGGIVTTIAEAGAAPKDGEIALPADYKTWPKFLSEVQREDAKQVRELFVSPAGSRSCPTCGVSAGHATGHGVVQG